MDSIVINVFQQVGEEARSRINANKLQVKALPVGIHVVLDFEKVQFVSRSFADEMIEQLEERHANFQCVNENCIIHNIIKAVISGRGKERNRTVSDNANIVYLKSVKDMSIFFNSLS